MSKKGKLITEAHYVVFCCQGSDCSKNGAHDTFKSLRGAVREAGLKGEVRCIESECTGLCKFGPIVIVCGGEGVTWYRKIKAKDAEELVESHLVAGHPLAEKLFSD